MGIQNKTAQVIQTIQGKKTLPYQDSRVVEPPLIKSNRTSLYGGSEFTQVIKDKIKQVLDRNTHKRFIEAQEEEIENIEVKKITTGAGDVDLSGLQPEESKMSMLPDINEKHSN